MRLAEGIAVEGKHHVPELARVAVVDARGRAAREEAALEVLEGASLALLGEDLAQAVGQHGVEARRRHGHAGNVLLVHHDAVGLPQRLLDGGGQAAPAATVEAAQVLVYPLVGRRPDDGAGRDEVPVIDPAHLEEELPHRRRLDVEDPHAPPRLDQVARRGVGVGALEIPREGRRCGVVAHQIDAVPQHREGAVAQEVYLDESRAFGPVLFPGEDGEARGRGLDMAVVGDRPRRDDDAPRVGADVAGHSPDHPCQAQQLRRKLLHRAQPQGPERALYVLFAHAKGEGRLAQGAAPGEAAVVGHHGRPPPVVGEHRRQDAGALVPGKVDVDVGRILSSLVEEALEEKVVFQGIDVGEPEEVGDKARGRASAPAGAGAASDDVADDEEISREALVADDAQLALEPGAQAGAFQRLWTVAAPRPLGAEGAQEIKGLLVAQAVVGGKDRRVREEGGGRSGLLGELAHGGYGFGEGREQGCRAPGRDEGGSRWIGPPLPLQAGEGLSFLHRPSQAPEFGVAFLDEAGGVLGQKGEAEFAGDVGATHLGRSQGQGHIEPAVPGEGGEDGLVGAGQRQAVPAIFPQVGDEVEGRGSPARAARRAAWRPPRRDISGRAFLLQHLRRQAQPPPRHLDGEDAGEKGAEP